MSKAEDILIHEKKVEQAERISLLLSIISIFIGFLAIPFAGYLFQEIANNISAVVATLVVLLSYSLEIPILWLWPKVRWYLRVMKLCHVKKKEVAVYDSLIPFERVILTKAFPKIRWLLDES
jgi:membrane protein YdbS with pleckstrin-like domain